MGTITDINTKAQRKMRFIQAPQEKLPESIYEGRKEAGNTQAVGSEATQRTQRGPATRRAACNRSIEKFRQAMPVGGLERSDKNRAGFKRRGPTTRRAACNRSIEKFRQ